VTAGPLLLAVALSACTTVLTRSPVPEADLEKAAPYGIRSGLIRTWGDSIGKETAEALVEQRVAFLRKARAAEIAAKRAIQQNGLALSGGGPDGAFGAGLLNGWTARGDRPEFQAVTGISTGAIIALFAFLGPDYDDELKEIYTTYTTDQLLSPAFFAALTGGTALADTSGYRRLIERYVDDDVVRKLREEHRKGRVLLIGTTNLDANRPVVWNIGEIAASGHPEARRLIHDVIQASSAIPAAFPPVLVPVETADGRRHDEMHVDGGATQQVMLFSPEVPMRKFDQALGAKFDRTVYIVVNNKLDKSYDPVRPRVLSIAGAAVSSLIGGSGTGDVYKLYAIAQRDGIAFNVVWIPREFSIQPSEPFDPVYMKALFDVGYEYGLAGGRFVPRPPDFAPWPEPTSPPAGKTVKERRRPVATTPATGAPGA
jgi:predicted acylesterase/phospholipase RssA